MLELRAGRKHYHEALAVVVCCGCGSYDERVAEDSRCRPFDIVVRCYGDYFGSYCADYITFNPARTAHAGSLVGDCFFDGVWVFFCARTLTDLNHTVAVNHDDLPCGVVVAEDTYEVDVAYRKSFVPECAVTRCAHCEGGAVAVLDSGVLLFVCGGVIGGEFTLTAFGETYVAETHELALPFAQTLGRGAYFAERVHIESVDVGGNRKAVELSVVLEIFKRHERNLIGVSVLVPRPAADLLQAGVLAYVHAGDIEHDVLADTIVEVEVVGVDGESHCGSLVLDDEALEHIAFFVRRNNAAVDYKAAVGVVGILYCFCIIGCFVPESLLKLENCGVGLHIRLGHVDAGSVDIVLACG